MTANHETYLLMASTQNDMEDWVKSIRRVIWAPFGGGKIRTSMKVISYKILFYFTHVFFFSCGISAKSRIKNRAIIGVYKKYLIFKGVMMI